MSTINIVDAVPVSTLDGAINNSVTSLDVAAGDGASFPSVPFAIQIDDEGMLVTAKSTDTFTVTREYTGTAASHEDNRPVIHVATAVNHIPVDDTTDHFILSEAVEFPSGSAGNPSMTFSADNSMGWYRPAANEIAYYAAGSDRLNINASTIALKQTTTLPDGGATTPSLRFASDQDLGFYRVGTNELGITANNAVRWKANPDHFYASVTLGSAMRYAAGSASTPSFTFVDDLDTGLYRITANEVGIAAGTTMAWRSAATYNFSGSGNGAPALKVGAGSVSAPAYTFEGDGNTGFYWITGDYFAATAGGVIMQQWGKTGGGTKEIYMYGLLSDGTDPYVRIDTTSGILSYDSSRRAIKKNIKPLDTTTEDFMRLQPSRFNMRAKYTKNPKQLHFGLVAEEVADVFPNLGVWGNETPEHYDDPDDAPEKIIVDWNRSGLTAINTHEIQKLVVENQDLRAKVEEQDARIARLEEAIGVS